MSGLLKRIEQHSSQGSDSESQAAGGWRAFWQHRRTTGTKFRRGINLKELVQRCLLEELNLSSIFELDKSEELRAHIDEIFNMILAQENIVLARNERRRLHEQIVAEILGFGPFEPLLEDPNIKSIMIIGSEKAYIERKGLIEPTPVFFENESHLRHIVERIAFPLGQMLHESSPFLHTRLPDGTRAHIALSPIAIDGTAVTMRKHSKVPLTVQNIIDYGSATVEMMEFLRAVVIAGINIIVTGGPGAGKTTLANILSGFIPFDQDIITLEHIGEFLIHQDHVFRLEALARGVGSIAISPQEMMQTVLTMHPQRIFIGQNSGVESLFLIEPEQLKGITLLGDMQGGDTDDILTRLEFLAHTGPLSNSTLPVIQNRIAANLGLIIQIAHLHDGSRRITRIAEVQGVHSGRIHWKSIFDFEQIGMDGTRIIGRMTPTGVLPNCLRAITDIGIDLWPGIFGWNFEEADRKEYHQMQQMWEERSGHPYKSTF